MDVSTQSRFIENEDTKHIYMMMKRAVSEIENAKKKYDNEHNKKMEDYRGEMARYQQSLENDKKIMKSLRDEIIDYLCNQDTNPSNDYFRENPTALNLHHFTREANRERKNIQYKNRSLPKHKKKPVHRIPWLPKNLFEKTVNTVNKNSSLKNKPQEPTFWGYPLYDTRKSLTLRAIDKENNYAPVFFGDFYVSFLSINNDDDEDIPKNKKFHWINMTVPCDDDNIYDENNSSNKYNDEDIIGYCSLLDIDEMYNEIMNVKKTVIDGLCYFDSGIIYFMEKKDEETEEKRDAILYHHYPILEDYTTTDCNFLSSMNYISLYKNLASHYNELLEKGYISPWDNRKEEIDTIENSTISISIKDIDILSKFFNDYNDLVIKYNQIYDGLLDLDYHCDRKKSLDVEISFELKK